MVDVGRITGLCIVATSTLREDGLINVTARIPGYNPGVTEEPRTTTRLDRIMDTFYNRLHTSLT